MTSSSVKAIVTPTSDRSLRVERVLKASRARVWRAYTQASQLAQWWGRGNPVDVVTFDFQRGGHWRFVEHAHGQQHGFEGRFGEIVEGEKIVQTFEWDGLPTHVIVTTTTFHDTEDGHTRLAAESVYLSAADLQGMLTSGMEGGMNESFAALDRLLIADP